MSDFRPPTPWDRHVVLHMLRVVKDNVAFVEQVQRMLIHTHGDEKQFDILIPGLEGEKAKGSHCIALGAYVDDDGYTVNLGLHCRGAALDLWERYKVGPPMINEEPDMGAIKVWAH